MPPICPECEATFELGAKQARIGTLVPCPECQTELEVIAEAPAEVTYVREPTSEYDWLGPQDSSAHWRE